MGRTADTPTYMCNEYKSSIRLFVDSQLGLNMAVALDKAQSHYVVTVMRQKVGMYLEVFNGRDGSFHAEIEKADKKSVTLRCVKSFKEQKYVPDIWFLFAPIKRTRLDFMAQKATELGASAIWPIFTAYTQMTRINEERLHANAIEAAEQCGRLDIPQVMHSKKLMDVLADWPEDRHIVFCDELAAGQPQTLEILQSLSVQKAAIIIGPEGGFAASERTALLNMPKVVRLSLGPRILRADTAGLAALTLLQAFCGDWVET